MPKFVPRQRKQKHRQQEPKHAVPVDTNAAQITPTPTSEKEARRQNLREELRSQHEHVSAKKQKRLDKYIVC